MTTHLLLAALAQQLAFTPYHADGIYAAHERVGWNVSVAPGQTAAGTYTYAVKRDGLAVIARGTLDLSTGRAVIETSLARPGMVLVEVRPPVGTPETAFHGASRSEVGRVLLGAAVAPREIRPSGRRPPDFDAFWAAELRRLDSVPPEPELTPHESGRADAQYFTIRMNNVNGAHIYGQLARPARPEGAGARFPALLILQWASPPYPLQREWVTDYAARGWLVLNVEPHDVPSDMPQAFYDALPQIIKNYRLIGRQSRDETYFLPMYLGDYRAAEYLASRPDWDGKTLVVMGTSMGGQQSFAVAGLEPRVTALIVNVPAGCDFLGPLTGRAAPYPNWDVERPDVGRTAGYFDAVNFAPRVRARALVSMGFIDETSPPAGIWAAFNLLTGPKEVVPLVDAPHNHLSTPEEVRPWVLRSAAVLADLVR